LGIGGAALDILHGDVRGQTLVGVLDGLHHVHVQFHIGGAHRAAEHCQTDDQPTDYCDEPACSQARISLITLPYTTLGRSERSLLMKVVLRWSKPSRCSTVACRS